MSIGYLVDKHSIVRQIWGASDTILFIFAGATAEFAFNEAVNWLYFKRCLPADPLGRLFSTVFYAKTIVFLEKQSALRAIDSITAIHASVEAKRSASIPDLAFRDVLFILIHYSISSFEVLERALSRDEKQEVFEVFHRVGSRMRLKGLPDSYEERKIRRQEHLHQNLEYSHYTDDLFSQYRKHLGVVKYWTGLEAKTLV